jgi:cytochrome c-type biogenesis protein CcmF
MYLLGTILIVSGIVAALLASVSYVLVTRGHSAALNYGRFGTRAALCAVLLVVALIVYLFVARRYDIKYVYDYSSAELEFRFRVASLWAGQPGSFVIWALWGLIAALGVVIVGGFAALAWRWRDIPARPLSEKLLSRDSFFVLLILGLSVIATVIEVGTSMPVISAFPGVGHALQGFFSAAFEIDNGTKYAPMGAQPFTDGRFGLVGSFYSATVPPLGVILALLLTIGPLLGWRDTNPRHLLRALRWPGLAAVIVTCAAVLLGARDALPLAYIGLGSLAAGTNILMIVRILKSGWLRIGGYLAHVGMAVLIAGVIGSGFYATPDQKIVVPEGDTIGAYGYDFSFNGWRQNPTGKGVLDMTVTRGNETFNATPTLYFNPRMGATMAEPSIKSELFRDLYISPA